MQPDKMKYWATPRKGANFFNAVDTPERFDAARALGLEYIRLTPSKWKGEKRDFLIGDADRFDGIPPKDLALLRKTLDTATKFQLKVIVVPLSLPGCRWRQHNGNKNDLRLWQDSSYHRQSARFWQELARALKGHPAVYGYNLINEPTPEMVNKRGGFWDKDPVQWATEVHNTPADLNTLYRTITQAIRTVDKETPIVLDAAEYASPLAFPALEKQPDPRTLYAFHMYEPWVYTNLPENNGRFTYPGIIEREPGKKEEWNIKAFRQLFQRITNWAKEKKVPQSQIMVGEFGTNREVLGADRYLEDLIRIFNENHWHWSYYSFREDVWQAMDYEFGSAKLPGAYWQAQEQGKSIQPYRKRGRIWEVIRREFPPKRVK